jgi:hypothetical protein
VVGPQTARDGVVAIDPHTTRSGVAWDYSPAGTNDDISRFGMMPSCGGVRRERSKGIMPSQNALHFLQLIGPVLKWCAGRTVVTGNGL